MSTPPEIPYTDRNVREDPTLATWAYEYLKNYGGSFEPLVNAQELLAEEGGLPTHLIRTVLNCMRHDTNVAMHMPKPTPYITSVPALRTRDRIRTDGDGYVPCGKQTSHNWHSHEIADEIFHCKGVPWPINRMAYMRPATVHVPFARARTGKFWHHVDRSRNAAGIQWYPEHHDYGFDQTLPPVLIVKLICKYPSTIREPILFDNITDVEEKLLEITECPHCIDVVQTPRELRA